MAVRGQGEAHLPLHRCEVKLKRTHTCTQRTCIQGHTYTGAKLRWKRMYLHAGYHATEEQAALAQDAAAYLLYGRRGFARDTHTHTHTHTHTQDG